MPSRRLKAPESACEYTCLQRFHHLRSGNPFFRQLGGSSRPFQGPRRRRLGLFYVLHFRLRDVFPESDASATGRTFPPGLINSNSAFSSAETSFIRESTFPRITPS